MKKFLFISLLLFSALGVSAEEISDAKTENTTEILQANQIIEMEDNKINVIVMKQPLNENSNQKITLKRNWLGVYIQVNGKVKVNPLRNTYEVE